MLKMLKKILIVFVCVFTVMPTIYADNAGGTGSGGGAQGGNAGRHLFRCAGEGDGDVVVFVVGRPGHRDGNGILLPLCDVLAAGIGQFAAADGQAGQV